MKEKMIYFTLNSRAAISPNEVVYVYIGITVNMLKLQVLGIIWLQKLFGSR